MKQLYSKPALTSSIIQLRTLSLAMLAILLTSGAAYSQSSTGDGKFNYPVTVQSFLPGTLVNWTANLDNNKVVLSWVTTVEKNTLHFTVQKSFNAVEYMDAAVLFAAGNSDMRKQYVFSDNVSINVAKIIYYRLKMVDMDGNVKYSDVRTVRSNKPEGIMLEVYPNPAVNELKLTISSTWVNQQLKLEVFNISGVLIKAHAYTKAKERESINVADLARGMYVLKVSNGAESTVMQFAKN